MPAANSAVGWDVDPEVAGWPGFPRLLRRIRADVCVVGLGGSGLAAVGAAIRRGLSVVGLDAGRVAAGAAGRNGGFLLAGPAIAVHQAATGWGLDTALALYRQTLDEIAALQELLGPEVIRAVGSLRTAGLPGEPFDAAEAADRERELADCQRQLAIMTEHGLAAEWYDGELGPGLYLPDDAAMNPARRALGLSRLYQGRAQLFENTPVLQLETGLVTVPDGAVAAEVVVVAVDGRLEIILPELADRVRTTRLQMAAYDPIAPGRLPCPAYSRWGYDYAQQDSTGRLFVGGGRDQDLDNEWTLSTEPTPVVQGWIDRIAARFAGGPVRATHRWAASAGYTKDARPIVAEVRPGIFACGGYNGTGNLVGPIAARAALDYALDGLKPGPYFAG